MVLIGLVPRPMMAQDYKLGDVITNDDGSRGVVFYVNPDGSGGWMVALTDASTGCPWGTSDDIPTLANQNLTLTDFYQQLLNDTDGYDNTEIIRVYQNNSTLYAAGMVDFAHGWYLPSAGQLRKLFGNLAIIEEAIAAAGGSSMSTSNSYWSSTEKDASQAWVVQFQHYTNYGLYLTYSYKTDNNNVRAIHDFGGGPTIMYDTTLYYYWNTGATTPYIEVSPLQTTTYTVTASTEFGCSATAEQTVFVNPSGTEHVYDTVCAGYAYEGYGFALTPEQTQTQGETTLSRDIGGGECSATLTLHLYKRGPTAGPTLTASTCENEAYIYNGYAYSVAGTYHQYYTAASGCDSIVTINLSVLPVSSRTIEQETCNSLTWNGEVYTESGTYEQTLQNQYGCDSVVTMYLTVNRDITRVISDTTCGAYTWNGQVYDESGQYTQTFMASTGCDSIVILNLTINGALASEWTNQSCDSYTWNGIEYTQSGDYEQTFQSVQGCDSIVTLHLTINDVLTTEWAHQSCNSYTWNGIEYTQSGDYEQTFQSVQGCDSIVTLHLEFVETYETFLDTVHCGSYWFNGQEIETSGYYEGEFVSSDGCDSIVHLQLTVEHFPEAPIMEGQHIVYVATGLQTGIYHYEANPVPNATHYEWSLTSPGWLMDTIGTSCTLMVIYPGTGTLTFRAWNECGYSEIQKVINAGFFDIAEHEMVFVNVYPNPAKYKAVVESEGILRIKVFSMTGQLLQEIEGNGDDNVEISLRENASAPYLLEVMTRKGLAYVKLNVVR